MASGTLRARHAPAIISVDTAMAALNVWLRAGTASFDSYRALLRKSRDGRTFPFPGQTYPARCVIGVPRTVKRFRMAALI